MRRSAKTMPIPWLTNPAAMMDWLSEGLGLPMQATAEHSNAHSLTSTENGLFGEQLVRALKKKLEENNVGMCAPRTALRKS